MRQFHKTHPNYARDIMRKFRKDHPERVAAIAQRFREAHREEINAWARQYRKANVKTMNQANSLRRKRLASSYLRELMTESGIPKITISKELVKLFKLTVIANRLIYRSKYAKTSHAPTR
jgi:hypothetical protein